MSNNQPEHSDTRSPLQAWIIFALGFLVAIQLGQFVMMFFLYRYINNVEHRLDTSVKDSRTEIIQLFKRE